MENDFRHKKIRSEKTIGEKLSSARKRLGYSLELAEKETKVSLKYLQPIENDDYDKLPVDVYVMGFLRRYSQFLSLDSTEIIEKFRLERKLKRSLNPPKSKIAPNLIKLDPDQKLTQVPGFIITPKMLVSSLVVVLVLGISSYIWYQIKGFAAAPPLELATPISEQIVAVETITIAGQTDPGASLSINNQAVAVDPEGNFIQVVKLANGVNNIEITAKNKAQKEAKKVIRVLAEY